MPRPPRRDHPKAGGRWVRTGRAALAGVDAGLLGGAVGVLVGTLLLDLLLDSGRRLKHLAVHRLANDAVGDAALEFEYDDSQRWDHTPANYERRIAEYAALEV